MNQHQDLRESVPGQANPLGMEGIEFIEYATSKPQALGKVLEAMGFCPVARHRSREVTLYRQANMNLIVNVAAADARLSAQSGGHPVISAVAFRVRDALAAHKRCMELGAWEVPSRAQAMELHIPAIHGPGGTRFYFVDRWKEFSIYSVDFVPIAGANQNPPAIAGHDYFGVVQYIGPSRSNDWMAWYEHLFGFTEIADDERFGILPKGKLMRSACGKFLWQLIEPDVGVSPFDNRESLERIGVGVADVNMAVAQLKSRGVDFVESEHLHPEDRGALTRSELGSVSFELVHQG